VVVGYDLDRGIVILHSGVTRFLEMPLSTFEHTWARGGYWGLVTLRPGDIPEPVAENIYVEAVAGVERAGRIETAAQAYRAAVRRWPSNLVAGMGLGNTLYRMGERRAAAEAYRSVTRSSPRSADAFNNLAHVLGELGNLDEAERAARTAVKLGGANIDAYRETLQSVLAARKSARAAVY
jgi:predicted Zn-dependent protease